MVSIAPEQNKGKTLQPVKSSAEEPSFIRPSKLVLNSNFVTIKKKMPKTSNQSTPKNEFEATENVNDAPSNLNKGGTNVYSILHYAGVENSFRPTFNGRLLTNIADKSTIPNHDGSKATKGVHFDDPKQHPYHYPSSDVQNRIASHRMKLLNNRHASNTSGLKIDLTEKLNHSDSKHVNLPKEYGSTPKFIANGNSSNESKEGNSAVRFTLNKFSRPPSKPKVNLVPFTKQTINPNPQLFPNSLSNNDSHRSQHSNPYQQQLHNPLGLNKYSPSNLPMHEQLANEHQSSYSKAISFLKDNRTNHLPHSLKSKASPGNNKLKLDLYRVGMPQKGSSKLHSNSPGRLELPGYGNSNRTLSSSPFRRENDSSRDSTIDSFLGPADYLKYINDDINKSDSQRSGFGNLDERMPKRRYQPGYRIEDSQVPAFNELGSVLSQIKTKQPDFLVKNDDEQRSQNNTPAKLRSGFESATKLGNDTRDSPSLQGAYNSLLPKIINPGVDSSANTNNSKVHDGYKQLKMVYDDRQRKTPSPMRIAYFDSEQPESKNFRNSFYRATHRQDI